MLLKIKVGDGFLQLFDDTKIPVRLNNPMFNEIGSHSFSFDIPGSFHNFNILDFDNRIGRLESSPTKKNFKLFFNNTYLFTGDLIAKSSSNKINCFFLIAESSFFSDITNLFLPELSDSEVNLDLSKQKSASQGFREDFILAPTFNTKYKTPAGDNLFNRIESDDVTITTSSNNAIPYSKRNCIPFYRLSYILKLISIKANININNIFFSNYPELENLLIYANKLFVDYYSQPHNYISELPNYSVKNFLNDIKLLFNLSYFIDASTNTLIIINTDNILNSLPTNDFSKKISNVKVIRESFEGLHYTMSKDKNDSSLDTFPITKSFDYIYDHGKIKKETSCGLFFEYYVDYLNQVNRFAISPASESPSTDDTFDIHYHFNAKMPYVGIDEDNSADILPRLFFYRGYQQVASFVIDSINDTTGNTFAKTDFKSWIQDYMDSLGKYPLITQSVNDANGNKITDANIELYWEGDYGLINTFHKTTLAWYKNRKVKIKGIAYLSLDEIKKINMWEKFRKDNQNYLFDKLSFNIESNKISLIDFTAFRV